jgi:prepilin-type N-terminal cleavage/methylation domain-containing protein
MITKLYNQTIKQVNNRGFTLLELIIVFTVIAIISTIGTASFVNYSRSQSLQSAASILALTLSSAKSSASSQVIPDACSGKTLSGYKVVIDDPPSNPSTKYSLYVVCGDPLDPPLIETLTLPDNGNIIFNLDPTQTTTQSIFFTIINGGVQGAGNIVLTGYNKPPKTVTIDNIGNVSIK